jgi:2-iminobutanoate/2-iminopropanoate deaminase
MNQPQAKRPVFSPYTVVPVGTGRLVFVSGQISRDPSVISVRDQSRAIFKRMGELLHEAGADFTKVVRVNAYLTDLREYEEYNEVRREIWPGPVLPASTSVGVAHLMNPFNKIEVDSIAYIPG